MSEHFLSCQNISNKQSKALEIIDENTVRELDKKFGRGYPHQPRNNELAYHNGYHGRNVGNAALKLCSVMELGSLEQRIAQTAGYAHDIVQLQGRGIDESQSADYVRYQLEKTNLFPLPILQMASLAILATEPTFTNNRLTGQKATEMQYPDTTTELVAKSVASGDLGDIYQPHGPYLARQLFREIHRMKPEDELPFDAMVAFQQNQLAMLESYQYPLPQAERVLATHKPQVICYSQNVLTQLTNGTIDNWSDLIQSDKAFIRQNT